jgi:hypothetical protein
MQAERARRKAGTVLLSPYSEAEDAKRADKAIARQPRRRYCSGVMPAKRRNIAMKAEGAP